jgi:hypothetical protein
MMFRLSKTRWNSLQTYKKCRKQMDLLEALLVQQLVKAPMELVLAMPLQMLLLY